MPKENTKARSKILGRDLVPLWAICRVDGLELSTWLTWICISPSSLQLGTRQWENNLVLKITRYLLHSIPRYVHTYPIIFYNILATQTHQASILCGKKLLNCLCYLNIHTHGPDHLELIIFDIIKKKSVIFLVFYNL